MSNYFKTLVAIAVFLIAGCSEKHLISDKKYREIVVRDFMERKQIAVNRTDTLFSIFKKNLSQEQSEALQFLFAYMPLNDLSEYSGEYYLANADVALLSRKDHPWGSKLPEDIFLHYVLPVRVNNENLDSFRIVLHKEIDDRIKGLNMTDAALEINHWCHEKVAYQPSDIRTSSPLNTILSARGRCGEESTFTVSALRAAGIPSRQVYSPRWAHTDDNHAWVEVWIDGNWYYMGACEPEPVLDRGWFTEPARRAMLIYTKSFGAAFGKENTINSFKYYSEVNNLRKYAVTKRIYVRVLDSQGRPVKDASVEYQLYNYSEFYPLATIKSDKDGVSSFETGLGDLLIWARKGENFGFKKISVTDTDTVNIPLGNIPEREQNFDLDLNVPVAPEPLPGIPPELVNKNADRLKKEDEIRQDYINSWIKPEESKAIAHKLNTVDAKISSLLAKSMGNYKTIVSFLEHTTGEEKNLAIALLEIISDKDLRDTREYILADHIKNLQNPFNYTLNDDIFIEYILNPRVANEQLTDWRGYFLKKLPDELKAETLSDPMLIRNFIEKTIQIKVEENYYKTPITPVGVNELKVSDRQSRAIYFVAICRSLGIPARLEQGTNTPQFYFMSSWNDVFFSDEKAPSGRGFILLSSDKSNPLVPEYYINFTIARFEDGRYNTLEYDYNKKITDFYEELKVPSGHYMIVTGNRLNDSKILSTISFFDLNPDQHLKVRIKLRK